MPDEFYHLITSNFHYDCNLFSYYDKFINLSTTTHLFEILSWNKT